MVFILLTHVYYPEVIDNEGKRDGTHFVLPESMYMMDRVITVGGEAFDQSLANLPACGNPNIPLLI
jgi:hypothetical protein